MFKNKKPAIHLPRRSAERLSAPSSFSYYDSRARRETDTNRRTVVESNSRQVSSHGHWVTKVPLFLTIIIIGLCTLYELGLDTNPQVIVLDKKAPQASLLRPIATYESATQKLLRGSIDNRTKLTLNTGAIASRLKQEFPELQQASLTLPFFGQRPILYIEAAQPVLALNTSLDGSFLLDAHGKILATNSGSLQQLDATLPSISDQTNSSLKVGQVALADSDAKFVQLIMTQFSAQHLAIQSLVLPPATRELDVHLSGQPYYVKFDLNDSTAAAQQVGGFLAMRQYLAGKGTTPAQYIDARLPGRIYYK